MVQLNQLPGVILLLGVVLVFGVVMGSVVDTLKEDECASAFVDHANGTYGAICFNNASGDVDGDGALSAAYNFSNFGAGGLGNMAGKLPLLGTILILAAVIGVVIGVFRFRGGGF